MQYWVIRLVQGLARLQKWCENEKKKERERRRSHSKCPRTMDVFALVELWKSTRSTFNRIHLLPFLGSCLETCPKRHATWTPVINWLLDLANVFLTPHLPPSIWKSPSLTWQETLEIVLFLPPQINTLRATFPSNQLLDKATFTIPINYNARFLAGLICISSPNSNGDGESSSPFWQLSTSSMAMEKSFNFDSCLHSKVVAVVVVIMIITVVVVFFFVFVLGSTQPISSNTDDNLAGNHEMNQACVMGTRHELVFNGISQPHAQPNKFHLIGYDHVTSALLDFV